MKEQLEKIIENNTHNVGNRPILVYSGLIKDIEAFFQETLTKYSKVLLEKVADNVVVDCMWRDGEKNGYPDDLEV